MSKEVARPRRVAVIVEESIKHTNIHAALSAFQGELKPLTKSGKVQFESKNGRVIDFTYTPLGDIMSAIYPLLAKHGLAVRHELTEKGIEAILTHETFKMAYPILASTDMPDGSKKLETLTEGIPENELRSGIIKISTGGGEMKDIGAAITYARRYSLTMLLGIASEDDKDSELLEQSAKNAIQTVYSRFKTAMEKSGTSQELQKSMSVLVKDLANLRNGKAPALGLSKEQYDDLIKMGEEKLKSITAANEKEGTKEIE